MLKATPTTSAKALEELFNKVWEELKVSEAWKENIFKAYSRLRHLEEICLRLNTFAFTFSATETRDR